MNIKNENNKYVITTDYGCKIRLTADEVDEITAFRNDEIFVENVENALQKIGYLTNDEIAGFLNDKDFMNTVMETFNTNFYLSSSNYTIEDAVIDTYEDLVTV